MKTQWLTTLLTSAILVALFSCNKNNVDVENPKEKRMVPVTFSVKDFEVSITDFYTRHTLERSVTSSIPADIKAIVYWLYTDEAQPKFVRAAIQVNSFNYNGLMRKSSPITGVFTDSLEYGKKYNAYFAALGAGLIDNSIYPPLSAIFGSQPPISAVNPELSLIVKLGTYHYPLNCDAFFSEKINLDVNGNSLDKSIALSRGVGKLVVKVNDANGLESNIQVKISSDAVGAPTKFEFKGLQNSVVSGVTSSSNYSFNPVNSSNNGKYIFATDLPFDVTISATINGNTYSKVVQNVKCYRNKVTILSGNLFDGGLGATNKGSFSINVDSTWSGDTTKVNF